MDDILRKVHEAGLTLKAGCGIGYEFSTPRPRGAYVSGAGAYTPAAVLHGYLRQDVFHRLVGGRTAGAQMGTFDIGHPDVMEFIRAKREAGRLRQFNLSLLITREFMEAVQQDTDWLTGVSAARQGSRTGSGRSQRCRSDCSARVADQNGLIVNDNGQVVCKIYRASAPAACGRDHVLHLRLR